MLTKETVKAMARKTGFDLVGITGAAPLLSLVPVLEERQRRGREPEFVSGTIEERITPKLFFPEAKSVIMTALNYYNPAIREKPLHGKLSRSTWGRDYHRVMGEMLERLGQSLTQLEPGFKYKAFVDTGPLVERELARRAGLGWIGKNCALITPEFGSWVFLGGMAVNVELPPDSPLNQSCGSCRRCLDACPSGALEAAHCVNPRRCLSYISQKKGYLGLEERKLLQGRLYGCDTCQEVCPVNHKVAQETGNAAFRPLPHVYLSLAEIVTMDNKQFKEWLGPTAAAWRGKTNLKRNAVIALGNGGDPEAIPLLLAALKDPSPIIRGHAAWALGSFAGNEAGTGTALQEALKKETDPMAKRELLNALEVRTNR